MANPASVTTCFELVAWPPGDSQCRADGRQRHVIEIRLDHADGKPPARRDHVVQTVEHVDDAFSGQHEQREDFDVVPSDRVETGRLCALAIGPVIRDRLGHPGSLPQVIAARKGPE